MSSALGGNQNICGNFLGAERKSGAQDLLANCRDPQERNRLAQEHLGRTLRCASTRPSNFPRYLKFADAKRTMLTKDACRRYNKRAIRKGFLGHAACWDADTAESEQFRQRMREEGIGRVLMYQEPDGRVVYYEEDYLRDTHWSHDLRKTS